jgi:hypothetical protein
MKRKKKVHEKLTRTERLAVADMEENIKFVLKEHGYLNLDALKKNYRSNKALRVG